MAEEKWSYKKTTEFIRLVHARPIIWRKDFVDVSARDSAINEIAIRMKTAVPVIRKKLKSMKENCTKEHIRMKAYKDFKPQWIHFHQYRFILNEEKPKQQQLYQSEEIDEILWIEEKNKPNQLCNESNMTEFEENSFQGHTNTKKSFKSTAFNDEFTLLGDHIANELRSLEDCKELQSNLQNYITMAMLEAVEAIAKQK